MAEGEVPSYKKQSPERLVQSLKDLLPRNHSEILLLELKADPEVGVTSPRPALPSTEPGSALSFPTDSWSWSPSLWGVHGGWTHLVGGLRLKRLPLAPDPVGEGPMVIASGASNT